MNEINDKMFEKSVGFLKKPKKYLNYLVKNIGYDTCRRTKEYDAKRCYKDCQVKDATYFVSFQIYFKFGQKLEKSKFAKSCTAKGGLYKCCIRRDKEFCHECRFCCTLSVCTTKDGSYFMDSSVPNRTDGQVITAKIGFQTDMKMYKAPDYRCLKPKPSVHSSKWPHYDMIGFRAAKTKQELGICDEIELIN